MSVESEEVIDLLPFVREGLIRDCLDRKQQHSGKATATTRTTTNIAMVTFYLKNLEDRRFLANFWECRDKGTQQ